MAVDRPPVRLRSTTVGQYQLGTRAATLFTDIEPRGAISYEYLLEVRDSEGTLELVVSAELSNAGTRCLGVFSGSGHANYPEQDRFTHAADFKESAFAVLQEWLGFEATPVVIFEELGPNHAPQAESVGDLGRLVVPVERAAQSRPQDDDSLRQADDAVRKETPMGDEPWTEGKLGTGALIREPDGSGRLELWASELPMLDLLGTLGDAQELAQRAETLYIDSSGHFDLIQFGFDDGTKERLRALGSEIERLDARLTYNGPVESWDQMADPDFWTS